MQQIAVRGALRRAASGWLVLLCVIELTACGASSDKAGDTSSDTPPGLKTAMSARTVYPAKREEWRADITSSTDSTMVPLVFRASRTTVALLQSSPTRISQFELNRHGMLLSSRPARIDPVLNAQVPRDILAPTDLSRVTSDGQVDVLDSATSTLVRETIGGFAFRRELPLLRGGSGRLCTMAPATLLHVRQFGEQRTLEAFMLTGNARDDALVGRHRMNHVPAPRLRFGNGDARRCLLIAERDVFVVTAREQTGARQREPLQIVALRQPGAKAPQIIDSMSTKSDTAVMQPFIVDAAIVDGGYVVLVGVESDKQGRVLDYYDERGTYIQSAMLPFTATAMTGSGPRFLALHQDEKYRWWLSSWLTPMAARGATAPPRLDVAPERQLFDRSR